MKKIAYILLIITIVSCESKETKLYKSMYWDIYLEVNKFVSENKIYIQHNYKKESQIHKVFEDNPVSGFGLISDYRDSLNSRLKNIEDSIVSSNHEKNGYWEYTEDVDEMTGKKIFFAKCHSTDTVYLHSPYGETTFTLTIRTGTNGKIVVSATQGQIINGDYNNKIVLIKFDNEKPFNVNYQNAADGSTNHIFLENEDYLISKFKKSKTFAIKLLFYQDGNQIITFKTDKLKWNH